MLSGTVAVAMQLLQGRVLLPVLLATLLLAQQWRWQRLLV
jgi:hypothetical protein